MNTGTPLDLTAFGSLLRGVGVLYWLLVLVVLFLSLKSARGWRSGLWRAAIVLVVMVGPVGAYVWSLYQKQQATKARISAATARFEERCKSAGEKIYRKVSNVDGVLLLNVRPKVSGSEYADANWPDAALPRELSGDDYLRTFLFWEHREDKRNRRGYLNNKPSDLPGYRFVDVKKADGAITRYHLDLASETAQLTRGVLHGQPARYAVSFLNFFKSEDRAYWIAGTKVVVTDTATNEVLAEKTWYSLERGQGDINGFRSPWLFAQSCPSVAGEGGSVTRFFVDQVLQPFGRN